MELPVSTMERIMRNAGAERLTEGAVRKLNEEAEELFEEIVEESIGISEEKGRKKVVLEDVQEASES